MWLTGRETWVQSPGQKKKKKGKEMNNWTWCHGVFLLSTVKNQKPRNVGCQHPHVVSNFPDVAVRIPTRS